MLDVWDVKFDRNVDYTITVCSQQLHLFIYEAHCARSSKLQEQLRITVDPPSNKSVVAKKDIPKGTLCLLPVSPSTYVTDKKIPTNTVDLGDQGEYGWADKPVKLKAYVSTCHRKFEIDTSGDRAAKKTTYEFYAPFWCVPHTNKTAEANMTFETLTMVKEGDFIHSGDYVIPVMTNSVILKKGDALRFLQYSNSSKYPPLDGLKKRTGK